MKTNLLILTAIISVVGCQSRNPNITEASGFGFTYDMIVPTVLPEVARVANLTPTPPPPKVAPSPPESPDVGVVTFYQAPGTPPPANMPRVYYTPPPPHPPAQAPAQPGPGQPAQPSQPYGPQGYNQPYPEPYGYQPAPVPEGYSPYGYPPYGSPSAYSDETVIFPNNNFNPTTSYGPNNGMSYGPNGQINGSNPNGFNPNLRPPFNAIAGATNTGNIQRVNPIPPGEPPGTDLVTNRPFNQPPGTDLVTNRPFGQPPGTQFRNSPQSQPATNVMRQLAPRGQPFDAALGPQVQQQQQQNVQQQTVEPFNGNTVMPIQPGATVMPNPTTVPIQPNAPPQQDQRVQPNATPAMPIQPGATVMPNSTAVPVQPPPAVQPQQGVEVQPVLPGAVPIPQNRVQPGTGGRSAPPPHAAPPPPPPSKR